MPAMHRCIIERKVIINVSVSVSSTQDSFNFILPLSGYHIEKTRSDLQNKHRYSCFVHHVTCCLRLHIQYILMHFSLQSWDNHGSYQFQKIASCALHLFWAGTQLGVWVPQVKSALISNNQGEVPLPRQSRATSHMFLTHRPALHHVLIIATTRDVTLERQQAAALGAEVKTAKLYIRTLKKKKKKTGCVQNPEKFQRESQKSIFRCWFHAKNLWFPL